MIDRRTRLITAGLLIAMPILFNLFFGLLQARFDYPDILRRPPDEVLRRFAAGGPGLIALWYGFALTPALFLPAAVLLRRAIGHDQATYLDLATPLAIAASLVQLLGLLRWPFLVPALAQRPRPGQPPHFPPAWEAELARVVELDPRTLGIPSAVWTTRLLAD
jgi:hypothetical protein